MNKQTIIKETIENDEIMSKRVEDTLIILRALSLAVSNIVEKRNELINRLHYTHNIEKEFIAHVMDSIPSENKDKDIKFKFYHEIRYLDRIQKTRKYKKEIDNYFKSSEFLEKKRLINRGF